MIWSTSFLDSHIDYQVYQKLESETDFTLIGSVVREKTFLLENIEETIWYHLAVTAQNSYGESVQSNLLSFNWQQARDRLYDCTNEHSLLAVVEEEDEAPALDLVKKCGNFLGVQLIDLNEQNHGGESSLHLSALYNFDKLS